MTLMPMSGRIDTLLDALRRALRWITLIVIVLAGVQVFLGLIIYSNAWFRGVSGFSRVDVLFVFTCVVFALFVAQFFLLKKTKYVGIAVAVPVLGLLAYDLADGYSLPFLIYYAAYVRLFS